MGRKPGERALRALEARVEEVVREGNSEAVASTSEIATMRWALGALDTRAVVLSADFGVREGALHVEGSYQNRGISLLDQLGGGGTSIPRALHVGGSYPNRGISLLDQLGGGGTSIPAPLRRELYPYSRDS